MVRVALVPALVLASLASSHAALLVTRAEDSTRYTTSLGSTNVLNFDTQPNNGAAFNSGWHYPTSGTLYTWSTPTATIGTLDNFYVKSGDQYGGDGATTPSKYIVQSVRPDLGGVTQNTLNLAEDSAYFGLWWSAGDGNNQMTFRLNGEIVAQFTTASLLGVLPAEYYGNPRSEQNTGEAYAFLNFFGQDGTTWDSISFTNVASTGFESDNWTTRTTAWGKIPGEDGPPPGVPVLEVTVTTVTVVPEPSSLLIGMAALGLGVMRRKRA